MPTLDEDRAVRHEPIRQATRSDGRRVRHPGLVVRGIAPGLATHEAGDRDGRVALNEASYLIGLGLVVVKYIDGLLFLAERIRGGQEVLVPGRARSDTGHGGRSRKVGRRAALPEVCCPR